MQSQQAIFARFKEVLDSELFGFRTEILGAAVTPENLERFWGRRLTPAEKDIPVLTDASIREGAIYYLKFAWEKALEHRGLSAAQSIEQLTEFCWLLELDISRIEAAGYAQYGSPKLKVIAGLLGQSLPDDPQLQRMMVGEVCCERGCDNGCGKE